MRDAAPVDRRRLKRGRSDWCGGGLGALGFRGNDRIQSRRKRQDKGFVGPYFKGQRLRRPAGCGPLPCLNVRGTLFTDPSSDARPMPVAPPVITAVFPASLCPLLLLIYVLLCFVVRYFENVGFTLLPQSGHSRRVCRIRTRL